VTDECVQMIGTSARLELGGYYSIYDLLVGMMLPSGNDAAVCLSLHINYLITKGKTMFMK